MCTASTGKPNLAVRRNRKKGDRRPINRRAAATGTHGQRVWSMDFVSDSLSGGRRLKYLTVGR
ncbi:MAG: hypothetical protein R3E56_03410 [Burkholderiaceae bacterium]